MSDDEPLRLRGRRTGRRLRVGQKALLESMLPQISLSLPKGNALCNPAYFFKSKYANYWLEIGFGKGGNATDTRNCGG